MATVKQWKSCVTVSIMNNALVKEHGMQPPAFQPIFSGNSPLPTG